MLRGLSLYNLLPSSYKSNLEYTKLSGCLGRATSLIIFQANGGAVISLGAILQSPTPGKHNRLFGCVKTNSSNHFKVHGQPSDRFIKLSHNTVLIRNLTLLEY